MSELRRIIRQVLSETSGDADASGDAADPTDVKGFYPYDLERGTDVHGYWYLSPGDKGSGDPGRPDDASEYIGMKPPSASK